VNFKDLLLRAKDGDQQAKEEIFLMYRPLLFKESCVNGIFDEDLFQELTVCVGEFVMLKPVSFSNVLSSSKSASYSASVRDGALRL